jgi:hypothetical protein
MVERAQAIGTPEHLNQSEPPLPFVAVALPAFDAEIMSFISAPEQGADARWQGKPASGVEALLQQVACQFSQIASFTLNEVDM